MRRLGSGICRADVGVRSFWLGEIGAAPPAWCTGFFEVDLAPYILKALRRGDGGCCNELIRC